MPYLNFVSTEPGADAQRANAGYMEYGTDQLNPVGSFPFRVDQNGNVTAAGTGIRQKQATTGINGFALVNGTPTILSWTAPNDGQLHRFEIFSVIHVAATETGGLVQVTYTPFPGATLHTSQLFGAALTADTNGQLASNPFQVTMAPGSTVSIVQGSALTAGGPTTVFAEIWGS